MGSVIVWYQLELDNWGRNWQLALAPHAEKRQVSAGYSTGGFRHGFASQPPGGTRKRRFDGINLKSRKLSENAATPTTTAPTHFVGVRVLITAWYVLSHQAPDRFAQPERIAQKLLRFAYQLGKARCPAGQSAAHFVRQDLDALHLGSDLTNIS